mmetsp:Transcript_11817/g.43189  ORF Transcript_11817/g.43189 Transcript_11817/m.43189 type:complete len:201 (-) Transcript_11817:657-1259(-)|eukprot:scaffold48_cov395-Prasinococcus_capsulatus_cf.AAC.38
MLYALSGDLLASRASNSLGAFSPTSHRPTSPPFFAAGFTISTIGSLVMTTAEKSGHRGCSQEATPMHGSLWGLNLATSEVVARFHTATVPSLPVVMSDGSCAPDVRVAQTTPPSCALKAFWGAKSLTPGVRFHQARVPPAQPVMKRCACVLPSLLGIASAQLSAVLWPPASRPTTCHESRENTRTTPSVPPISAQGIWPP